MTDHEDLVKKILIEHERHSSLPGSEFDLTNGPNDWVAIISKCFAEGVRSRGIIPSADEFEISLIKAAAVIFTALDHKEWMIEQKKLRK
jgi:hypothetical protein